MRPAVAQQQTCSVRTRRGGSWRILPSCWSYCERLDAGAISMPSRLPPIRATGVRLAKSDQPQLPTAGGPSLTAARPARVTIQAIRRGSIGAVRRQIAEGGASRFNDLAYLVPRRLAHFSYLRTCCPVVRLQNRRAANGCARPPSIPPSPPAPKTAGATPGFFAFQILLNARYVDARAYPLRLQQ
jgi:hypothetical protein